jgi:hypothetical protein
MSDHPIIPELPADPERLEQAYHTAQKAGQAEAFRQVIEDRHSAAPDNLLYAAWVYRLRAAAAEAGESFVEWAWVLPLAVLNGLVFWVLSDFDRFMITIDANRTPYDLLPTLLLLAAPLAAVFVLAYLALAGRRDWLLAVAVSAGLLAAGAYALWVFPRLGTHPFQEQYLTLMALHLPLLAWAGVGAFLVARHRDAENRFAFLMKSLEVGIMGGLFVIAGGLFTAITAGLFSALAVDLPEVVLRLFIAGGAGLILVVAVAVLYNPAAPPAGQSFADGLSKLVALLMRVLLPLTLLVLVVYIAFIPFNFREPFDNREVLIIYNGMLFAVIALLVGATPVGRADLSPRLARWLRGGIIAVAALALLVSVYALSAIVYRTALDRLTPNRLAFIGWNVVNIGLLALLLLYQARAGAGGWVDGLHRAFSAGTVAYTLWTLAVIVVVPWLFGFNRGAVEGLPPAVQNIVYETPDPILLKCLGGDPIYLLDGGEKRWIDSIETFEARGYVWRDVHFVTCDNLRTIPDGVPIPPDAGPPPVP